jgi:hypothetical protein
VTLYEYRCDRCRDDLIIDVAWDSDLKSSMDAGNHVHFAAPTFHPESESPCGGTYKRQFGFRLSTYLTVANPDSPDERTFHTERSYARHLRTQSAIATDRTGVEHRFVPVDLDDPSVRPKNMDRVLKERHDKEIAAGKQKSIAPTIVPNTLPGK